MANPNHVPAGSSQGGQFAHVEQAANSNATMNKILRKKAIAKHRYYFAIKYDDDTGKNWSAREYVDAPSREEALAMIEDVFRENRLKEGQKVRNIRATIRQ